MQGSAPCVSRSNQDAGSSATCDQQQGLSHAAIVEPADEESVKQR